jgi:hypothetical protein
MVVFRPGDASLNGYLSPAFSRVSVGSGGNCQVGEVGGDAVEGRGDLVQSSAGKLATDAEPSEWLCDTETSRVTLRINEGVSGWLMGLNLIGFNSGTSSIMRYCIAGYQHIWGGVSSGNNLRVEQERTVARRRVGVRVSQVSDGVPQGMVSGSVAAGDTC